MGKENVGISSDEGLNGSACPFYPQKKSQLHANAIEGCQLSPLGMAQRQEPSTHKPASQSSRMLHSVLYFWNKKYLAVPFLEHSIKAEVFEKSWSSKARLQLLFCYTWLCLWARHRGTGTTGSRISHSIQAIGNSLHLFFWIKQIQLTLSRQRNKKKLLGPFIWFSYFGHMIPFGIAELEVSESASSRSPKQ